MSGRSDDSIWNCFSTIGGSCKVGGGLPTEMQDWPILIIFCHQVCFVDIHKCWNLQPVSLCFCWLWWVWLCLPEQQDVGTDSGSKVMAHILFYISYIHFCLGIYRVCSSIYINMMIIFHPCIHQYRTLCPIKDRLFDGIDRLPWRGVWIGAAQKFQYGVLSHVCGILAHDVQSATILKQAWKWSALAMNDWSFFWCTGHTYIFCFMHILLLSHPCWSGSPRFSESAGGWDTTPAKHQSGTLHIQTPLGSRAWTGGYCSGKAGWIRGTKKYKQQWLTSPKQVRSVTRERQLSKNRESWA